MKFGIFQKIFFFVKIKFWKFNFRNRSKLNRNNSFKNDSRSEIVLTQIIKKNMTHQVWLMRKYYKCYIFNVTRVTYKNLIVKQWFGLESGSKWLTVVCEMNQVTRVKWLDLAKQKKSIKSTDGRMICLVRVYIRAGWTTSTVILEEVYLYNYSLITAIYITAHLMPFKQTINLVFQSTKPRVLMKF